MRRVIVTAFCVWGLAACEGGGGGAKGALSDWSAGSEGGQVIEAGTTGFGAGPSAEAPATDMRGTFTIDEHEVLEEDCTQLTPESDYLAGKKLTLTLYQEGSDLYGVFRSAEPGDAAVEPMEMFGTVTDTGFRLMATKRMKEDKSQQGMSIQVDVRADVASEGTVQGDRVAGTFDFTIDASVTVSQGTQTQSEDVACRIKTRYSGPRSASVPAGGGGGAADVQGGDGSSGEADAHGADGAGTSAATGHASFPLQAGAARTFALHGLRIPILSTR